jgi:YHS domain-containing protein
MKKQVISMIVFFISLVTLAQNDTKRIAQFNLDNKVALQGYDPVSYFKQNKAVMGKSDFTASYMGVTYKFSSAANKDVFIKNPVGYEPQFGGWCAFAMGESGEKVNVNPETFKIINGKLYLFYNAFFNNTLKSWNKDEANLKVRADSNWRKIFK